MVIAANHDPLWRRLAAAMGRPELAEDPRYATHAARGEHQDELDELIGAWAAEHTAGELDELLGAGGVVCAPVNNARDILADPHFRERGLIVDVRGRAPRSDADAGRRPAAERHAGHHPPAGAAGRSAPTPSPSCRSWASSRAIAVRSAARSPP